MFERTQTNARKGNWTDVTFECRIDGDKFWAAIWRNVPTTYVWHCVGWTIQLAWQLDRNIFHEIAWIQINLWNFPNTQNMLPERRSNELTVFLIFDESMMRENFSSHKWKSQLWSTHSGWIRMGFVRLETHSKDRTSQIQLLCVSCNNPASLRYTLRNTQTHKYCISKSHQIGYGSRKNGHNSVKQRNLSISGKNQHE